MLDLLEKQQKLTANQWKIAGAATLGDMLDFFDFFLIGFVLAFVVKDWHLTYGQAGMILLASGISAPFGSLFYGWLADKVGRRTALIASVLNVSIATGAMAVTPEGGWLYLVACRFIVGFGVTGLYSVDITLMQEFSPASKRGWFTGLTTTMLPAGSLLAAILGAFAAPYIGWRGLVAVGLVPALLCLYIRAFVPESPHWLLRKGRVEEARKALAWALQMDPKDIPLPTVLPPVEHTRWIELFKYPRSIIAGCLTGLTQTGGVALSLWMVTLFVMVLKITPPQASKLVIWYSLSAIAGRFFCSWISDSLGRRPAGILCCVVSAMLMAAAGYYNSAFVGGVSVFFLLIVAQGFLGSGNYSIVGPYMGELWPARLRGSGMGLVYGVGNLGKFIGPLGLALIAGSSNYVKPAATVEALFTGFLYFSYWYLLGAFAFWFIGTETRGRSIDDIDAEMSTMQARGPQVVTAVCGILAGAVSVAVQPFLPIAVFIGVGMTILSPSIGGALLVAVAAGIIAYFGTAMATAVIGLGAAGATGAGIIGLLGVLTVILTLVAGVASLITAFGKPAASPELAKAAAE
ncbi:MAG TPA: MFS transporter [Stellaceae bacterium]|nr:MFS transporter [Stellaceae bacterium]